MAPPESEKMSVDGVESVKTNEEEFGDDDIIVVRGNKGGSLEAPAESGQTEGCYICGRQYTTSNLINVGDKKYPKWRCRPCHNSAKIIERAAASEGDDRKESMSQLKRNHPVKWANLVLTCRVAVPGEPVPSKNMTLTQVSPSMCRSEISGLARKTIETELYFQQGVRDINGEYLWLSERQFKSHYKRTEDYGGAEAEEKWQRESDPSSGVDRRIVDGELQLRVRAPDRTENYVDRGTKKRALEVEECDEDENVLDESLMKKLRHEPCTRVQNVRASVGEPAPKKQAMDTSVHGVLSNMSGQAGGGAYEAAVVRAGACLAYAMPTPEESVVTAMEARSYITTVVKQLESKEVTIKSSALRKLEALVAQLGHDHEEVATVGSAETIAKLKQTVDTLAAVKVSCKGWTRANFVTKFAEGMETYQTLVGLCKQAHADLEVLKTVRILQVRANAGDRRKIALVARRLLRGLLQQNFWKSLVTWVAESCYGVEGQSTELKPVHLVMRGASSKHNPESAVADQILYLHFCTWLSIVAGADCQDRRAVCKWQGDQEAQDTGKMFAERFKAIAPAIARATMKMQADISKCGALVMTANVRVKEADENKYVRIWTPSDFLGEGMEPTGFFSFAPPAVLLSQYMGFRRDHAITYHGLPSFYYQWQGVASIITWRMSAVIDAGSSVKGVNEYFENLSPSDASKFMHDNQAAWLTLHEGDTCFIPCGHFVTILGFVEPCVTIQQPWLSMKMMKEDLSAEVLKEVIAYNVTNLEQDVGDESQTVPAHQALSWFKSFGPLDRAVAA
eukprot:6492368-Amphidinium_carterae.1